MTRRVITAREQVEMLAPWRTATTEPGEGFPITDAGFTPRNDNGRWDYRYNPELQKNEYHNWGVHPQSAPASKTDQFYGRTKTVYYDPELTDMGRDDLHFIPSYLGNDITDMNPPTGMLWRGMSKEEYEEAGQRGYFQSRGDANIGDSQVGKTYFSTNADSAGNYASGFALPEHKPTFTHPGYVVGIPDRPELPREGGHEVGVPGQIPFDSATHHYRVRPVSITPGSRGMYKEWNGWSQAGGSHPGALYHWEPHKPGGSA